MHPLEPLSVDEISAVVGLLVDGGRVGEQAGRGLGGAQGTAQVRRAGVDSRRADDRAGPWR